MSMLLAALAGGGQAYSQMAEQKQRENAIANIEQMRQQAEIEKEKRIEEAQVRSEQRGEARYTARRDSDMQFGLENAPRLAEAKLNAQKQEDKYSDSRFPTELSQKAQVAQATHITDPFEIERTQAATEHIRAQTESIKNPPRELAKVPEQVKLFLENTRKDIEDLEAKTADTSIYEKGADDPRHKANLDELAKKKAAYGRTMDKFDLVASDGSIQVSNEKVDPLSIDTGEIPSSLRPDRIEAYKIIYKTLGKEAANSVVGMGDDAFNAMFEKAKNTPVAEGGAESVKTEVAPDTEKQPKQPSFLDVAYDKAKSWTTDQIENVSNAAADIKKMGGDKEAEIERYAKVGLYDVNGEPVRGLLPDAINKIHADKSLSLENKIAAIKRILEDIKQSQELN